MFLLFQNAAAININAATASTPGDAPLASAPLAKDCPTFIHDCGSRYIDGAVAQLDAEGHEIREEDIARLSLLKHRNLNLLGRYSFTASVPAAGALRPLRDPDMPELDEDEYEDEDEVRMAGLGQSGRGLRQGPGSRGVPDRQS